MGRGDLVQGLQRAGLLLAAAAHVPVGGGRRHLPSSFSPRGSRVGLDCALLLRRVDALGLRRLVSFFGTFLPLEGQKVIKADFTLSLKVAGNCSFVVHWAHSHFASFCPKRNGSNFLLKKKCLALIAVLALCLLWMGEASK